ncbi:thaumatin, partial [Mycena latifolia]
GVPPATVAEFTLSGGGSVVNYDISLVDGFNIPMKITNNGRCGVPSCPANLNRPAPLEVKAKGGVAGCNSACAANLDGNPGAPSSSSNCCSGQYNTPDKCPSSGVAYYHYFKDACPESYAYVYDESSKTALYHCKSSRKADFTIEFCLS